jgi:nitrogen fixation NifU-like protein
MSDLRELYQEVILDHNKHPRNFKELVDANRQADGYNPLCGDKVTVYVQIEDERIADVAFTGCGCAISTASASVMTLSLKGKTLEEAEALFENFHDLIMGKETNEEELGKLLVFSGVSEFPMRVKCASLAWHTLRAALADGGDDVTTE